jgi:hypothetical protein
MKETQFGDIEQISCWRIIWKPTIKELLDLIKDLIEYIGMTPEGEPDIRHYPNDEGKGGFGCQVYQALTESYVIAGTWPDLGITRILLASCKSYSPKSSGKFIRRKTGAVVAKFGFYEY